MISSSEDRSWAGTELCNSYHSFCVSSALVFCFIPSRLLNNYKMSCMFNIDRNDKELDALSFNLEEL